MADKVTIAADSSIFARSSGDRIASAVELLTAGRKATMSTSGSADDDIDVGVSTGDERSDGCTSISSNRTVWIDINIVRE